MNQNFSKLLLATMTREYASASKFDHCDPMTWRDHQLVCFLKGHDVDWSTSLTPCRRCGEPLTYEQIGWPGAWQWLCARLAILKQWRKCNFCGGRLGRHTQDCQDVPF